MNDVVAPSRMGLLKLLEAAHGNQYVIPVYQRKYTWEAKKEVKQFLIDLEKLVKNEYNNHFLGIIIQLDISKGIGSIESSVVDGQQRLTTTFLTLYAIRYLFLQCGDIQSANIIENKFLVNDIAIYGQDKKHRLKPMVDDDDVYKYIVDSNFDSIQNKNSNIYINFFYIVSYLKKLNEEGYSLEKILEALNKLYVVSIPVTENDNPQRIFESINATGVKLTAADLIRNYLLMNLDSVTQENYYYNYWKKLEKFVSSNSEKLADFFRFYLAVKKFELVAKKNVYREFVSWVELEKNDTKQIFTDLNKYAQYYFNLQIVDISTFDVNLQDVIVDYRKIQSDLMLPLTLEFYKFYDEHKISADIFKNLMQSINTYMIRRGICDINSQNISRLFPSVLKNVVDKCTNDYSNINDLLNFYLIANTANTSGSYMPTDKQMMEFLYNANVYGRSMLKLILDRIELYNNPAPVDLSTLSIEHLMPQTVTDDWLKDLNTDMDTYNENLHRLGNLTLATKIDNSKMKNKTWDYKNKILENTSHLTLNKEVLAIDKWNLDCIDKRTKELIKKICEIYPYPDINDINSTDDGIDINTAMSISLQKIDNLNKIKCIKKNRIYELQDTKEGYFFSQSKKYPQKDKILYWFSYKDDLLQANNYNKRYYVFICRGDKLTVVKMPTSFIQQNKKFLDYTKNVQGEIDHYHIKICVYPDGMVSLQLPKKNMAELDICDLII